MSLDGNGLQLEKKFVQCVLEKMLKIVYGSFFSYNNVLASCSWLSEHFVFEVRCFKGAYDVIAITMETLQLSEKRL